MKTQLHYPSRSISFVLPMLLVLATVSCRKEIFVVPHNGSVKLGLIESSYGNNKSLSIGITQIGTQHLNYNLSFDTGSGGMVIDGNGILPASMITSSGFNFTGDSTVVNGITITNQQAIVEYGNSNSTLVKVYGNLAYASVSIGNYDGVVEIARLPFFIYYKSVDATGAVLPQHQFDVMGVSSEYGVTFSNNAYITSPFNYYDPGSGYTKGIRIAPLGTGNFSNSGKYISGIVTVGLSNADLNGSNFNMTQLTRSESHGYVPFIQATIAYNGKSISSNVVFDTCTEPFSYIEDKTASENLAMLPDKIDISVSLNSGYNYSYTTAQNTNLTYVENPVTSGANVSIVGLDYFFNNEYMINYSDHTIGFKNN